MTAASTSGVFPKEGLVEPAKVPSSITRMGAGAAEAVPLLPLFPHMVNRQMRATAPTTLKDFENFERADTVI